ncbi:hypothetical protein BaRGS_00003355, partial [Batillaria attramentaria]
MHTHTYDLFLDVYINFLLCNIISWEQERGFLLAPSRQVHVSHNCQLLAFQNLIEKRRRLQPAVAVSTYATVTAVRRNKHNPFKGEFLYGEDSARQ